MCSVHPVSTLVIMFLCIGLSEPSLLAYQLSTSVSRTDLFISPMTLISIAYALITNNASVQILTNALLTLTP